MLKQETNYEDCIISKIDGHINYNRYFHNDQQQLCSMLSERLLLRL